MAFTLIPGPGIRKKRKERKRRSHSSSGVWGWYWTLISDWFLRYRISILSFWRSSADSARFARRLIHICRMVLRFLLPGPWHFYILPAHRAYFGFRGKMFAKFAAFKGAKVIAIKQGDVLISAEFSRTPWFSCCGCFSWSIVAVAFIQFTKVDIGSVLQSLCMMDDRHRLLLNTGFTLRPRGITLHNQGCQAAQYVYDPTQNSPNRSIGRSTSAVSWRMARVSGYWQLLWS